MHTVKFAEKQRRRMACYYSKLTENAAGNKLIIDQGIGAPIESEESFRSFLETVRAVGNEYYEQLVLQF